jgi:multiple sugar transport system substrate-binding protein
MTRGRRTTLAALVVIGGIAGAAIGQAPVTIDFWGGWTGPDRGVMEQLVQRYQAETPGVRIELFTVQWTPLFDRFLTSFRAGQAPDILAMHPQDIASFAALNLLEPLGADVAAAGLTAADFVNTGWDGTFWGGQQYAFPLDLHMHAVYINADMFRAAGLDPARPPRTGEEFVRTAIRLTVDENGRNPDHPQFNAARVRQYGLGLASNHHGFYYFYALLAQQGQSFLNAAGNRTGFDRAAGERAWQFIRDLVYRHRVVPEGQTNQFQDWLTARVAMAVDGPWQLPAAASATFSWTTGPFPQIFERPAVWGSGHILTLPRRNVPAKREAALKFAAWLVRNSSAWAGSGNLPSLIAATRTESFNRLPGRPAFVESLPSTVFLPNIPKTLQVFSAAGPSPIVVASQSIILRDAPISQVLDQLIRDVDRLLAQP